MILVYCIKGLKLDPRDWETRVKSKSTFIAFAILILFFGAQCQKEFTVPEELIGVWVTDDPRYVDHPFEIKKDTLIFEQGLGFFDFDVFPIVEPGKNGCRMEIPCTSSTISFEQDGSLSSLFFTPQQKGA